MIQNRLFSAALLFAGLAQASAALAAAPQVIINQNQSNSCTVTPNSGTVFTLDPGGNVLVNGTYTAGNCGSQQSTGNPTFSFNPNPANLTIATSSLPSSGGTVTPSFVAYFANTCTGKVTATANCPAVPAPWGTGGTVCTQASGQTYCQGSASVSMPANPATTDCVYTFQAISCTNGNHALDVNSQTANVTVAGTGNPPNCIAGDTSGDLPGFVRQCSGNTNNSSGTTPHWDNTFAGLFGAEYPGSASMPGKHWGVTLNANQYGAFKFTTGSTAVGIQLGFNPSYGTTSLMSISTAAQGPGYFGQTTSLCRSTLISMSTKTGTTAFCKLAPNTSYYLNIAMADYTTFQSTCSTSTCTTGQSFDNYGT